jgi:hypothetical protein
MHKLCRYTRIINNIANIKHIKPINSTIFWDVSSYSVVEIYGGFRGNNCLHLLGRK